ncbi:MAG: aldo/keto reductase [Firmicutes bacterium]|nr:aldo/keto reductase [Bacillota bacterium]
MKRTISVLLSLIIMTLFTMSCAAQTQAAVIELQIGNPIMTVDGEELEIDTGRGTTPVIVDGRTLLPVRAVAEAMGGAVEWDAETQTAILAKGDTIILLMIDSETAFLNETAYTLDCAPIIQNERTMLPIRFIAESFGYDVEWDGDTQIVTLTLADDAEKSDAAVITDTEEASGSIVVYFSQTRTTKPLAEKIAELTGSDIYEITAAEPYTDEDIDYNDSDSRANREQNDSSARPAIAGELPDLSEYDTVFLGFPIWWGTNPRIINTFIDSVDLSGKTIMPFCTSHSSGISSAVSAIKAACPDSDVRSGFRSGGDIDEDEISEWLTENGIGTLSDSAANEGEVGVFNFETKTVMLNSGYEMPINGLGTYSLHGDTCINAVKSAIESGVRLFDTASAYGNEEEVGQAIREAIDEGLVTRGELFVITKIYPGSEMANPEESIQACLDRLDIGYVDMMLLHHPDDNDVKAYKAMEKFVKDGKIRSIGLSNWYVDELEEFLPQVDTTPALVQNEIHPYYQENDVIPYIQSLGIIVQGWYPLGGRGYTAELLGDETITAIAEAHGVSSAQVILRWNLQKGVVVIPGSSNPDHIKENTELYDFELTDEEMAQINALDRNEKHDWY